MIVREAGQNLDEKKSLIIESRLMCCFFLFVGQHVACAKSVAKNQSLCICTEARKSHFFSRMFGEFTILLIRIMLINLTQVEYLVATIGTKSLK